MLIFPMAGLSKRFQAAGYQVPKFQLEAHGRSLFAHSVGGFSRYFREESFLFITLSKFEAADFINKECTKLGIPKDRIEIVELEDETRGQADTVQRGLNAIRIDDQQPLTIFNIDTFRPGFSYPSDFDIRSVDGYLEVFKGSGDHWSFAKPMDVDANKSYGRVKEVSEKKRISELCSSGLYYFNSVYLFRDSFSKADKDWTRNPTWGEYYIAPLYNYLIEDGADIMFNVIDLSDIVFCGTPDEYQAVIDGQQRF